MTARRLTTVVATCAAVTGVTLLASPFACGNGRCGAVAQTAEAKPLKLKTFMRKPVASSATRTVKKKNGEYVKAATKRRTKQRAAEPKPAPESLSAGAAQAFAAYELARVRVVTPDETTGSAMLADESLAETAPARPSEPAAFASPDKAQNVQVVSAEEINEIDRKAGPPIAVSNANSPAAVSLDALSRDLAGSTAPKTEDGSWFQRMLLVLGGAFAAVVTLLKTVLG